MRRELGMGLVQDQAKKVQRLPTHADPAAVATATQFSGSGIAAIPVGIHEASLLCTNDPYSETGSA